MQITLKLYAGLTEYLPKGTKEHSVVLNVGEEETPYKVLSRYHVPQQKAHLVLLNGVYLSAEQCQHPVFKPDDVLAVWPPVAGG